MSTKSSLKRARELLTEQRLSVNHNEEWLAAALDAARLAMIEEIAYFAETHYCVMDPERPGKYIVHERPKHPCEPFAAAIRGLAAGAEKA